MEKKILIILMLVAASSLLWVFHFMGRDAGSDNFMQKANLEIDHKGCQTETSSRDVLTVLKPGFAVHQNEHTSYVLRPESASPQSVEKLRLTIEQPVCPLPASSSCERKRIDRLQSSDVAHFSIESIQVQPSEEWPEEYEFIYQRLRGNWSDLEASVFDETRNEGPLMEAVRQSLSAQSKTAESI